MSYILEALKKSDQERNRGTTPGLQTVHTETRQETGRHRWWIYLLTCALLLNAGLLLWWLQPWGHSGADSDRIAASDPAPEVEKQFVRMAANEHTTGGSSSAAQTARNRPTAVKEQPGSTGLQVPLATSEDHEELTDSAAQEPASTGKQPTERAETAPAVAVEATEQVQATQKHGGRTAKTDQSAPQTASPKATATTVKEKETTENVKPKPPEPVKPAPEQARPTQQRSDVDHADQLAKVHAKALDEALTSSPRIAERNAEVSEPEQAPENALPNLRSLPVSTQQEIPDLALSFLVYSNKPAERMVNINGQMMHEGQEVAPGLRLEEITADGVVFDFKGVRFRMGVL